MSRMCDFSARVNGKYRAVQLDLRKQDRDLDTAEAILMNTESAYKEFYRGATDADYDAELTERKLLIKRKHRPYILVIEKYQEGF